MITEISQRLRLTLPSDPENKLTIGQNQPVVGFKGKYALLKSYPDLMLQYHDGQLQNQTVLVLELGFTEEYAKLRQSARLWIEGTEHVRIVMLIKIREIPRYADPRLKPGREKRLTTQLPTLSSIKLDDVRAEDANDPSSPLLMYGLPFAGRFTASFELWRRNEDGEAELAQESAVSVNQPSRALPRELISEARLSKTTLQLPRYQKSR